jgi:hypothetical protein
MPTDFRRNFYQFWYLYSVKYFEDLWIILLDIILVSLPIECPCVLASNRSTHFWYRYKVKVTSQLQASAAYYQGKNPLPRWEPLARRLRVSPRSEQAVVTGNRSWVVQLVAVHIITQSQEWAYTYILRSISPKTVFKTLFQLIRHTLRYMCYAYHFSLLFFLGK